MSNVAIRVAGLSKQYHIGTTHKKYNTLRDTLSDAFVTPFVKVGQLLRGQASAAAGLREKIWALNDVTFEVKRGEVVGIIGHNGAGKSTLLKVLSRITEPSEGQIDLYGRVGSLLEVGTGFHPELTGRENIYLNGAILGMPRTEIDAKFDEIVAFAEVETFIDTPVKYYSSGMGLRLGFAVAAHLEPDILLVDEVLAVGDAAFQNKCMGKMGEVANQGRTVLFVSHNMAAIEKQCPRSILLSKGQMVADGPTSDVISEYLGENEVITSGNLAGIERPEARFRPIITSFHVLNERDEPTSTVRLKDPVTFEIEYEAGDQTRNLIFGILIHTVRGEPVAFIQTITHHGPIEEWPSKGRLRARIPSMPLLPGTYRFSVEASTSRRKRDMVDLVPHCAEMAVVASDALDSGYLPKAGPQGYYLVDAKWELPHAAPVVS